MDKHPEISVIVVARNEASFMKDCIASVCKQFAEKYNWELIIVDGMSEDNTKEIAASAIKNCGVKNYQILENPKKTLATGWNLGIKAASGLFVMRPDAHAILYPSYITKGLETLNKMPEVAVVGGTLKTLAKGFWGGVIREALSSRAGVGNSSFRTNAESGYKDTAVYGIYRKEVFEQVGYFDEKLVRHQDNEFHNRLIEKGLKIYMNREMQAGYYCRDSFGALLKQMYKIGYYLPDLAGHKSMGGLRLRHFAPTLFFLAIIFGLLLGTYWKLFFFLSILAFSAYITFILLNALFLAFGKPSVSLLLLLIIIPSMHFSYCLGTLMGFIKKPKKKT